MRRIATRGLGGKCRVIILKRQEAHHVMRMGVPARLLLKPQKRQRSAQPMGILYVEICELIGKECTQKAAFSVSKERCSDGFLIGQVSVFRKHKWCGGLIWRASRVI